MHSILIQRPLGQLRTYVVALLVSRSRDSESFSPSGGRYPGT